MQQGFTETFGHPSTSLLTLSVGHQFIHYALVFQTLTKSYNIKL